jgi:hypothetical protein
VVLVFYWVTILLFNFCIEDTFFLSKKVFVEKNSIPTGTTLKSEVTETNLYLYFYIYCYGQTTKVIKLPIKITSTNQQRQSKILQIYLQIIKNKINQLSINTKRKSNYRNNLSIQKKILSITHIYKWSSKSNDTGRLSTVYTIQFPVISHVKSKSWMSVNSPRQSLLYIHRILQLSVNSRRFIIM